VILNFPLTVGTGYQLGCGNGSTTTNLYRNATGPTYPYHDPSGLISITGNNVPDTIHYYFFYNWKLIGPPCTSARTPVNVVITGGPVAWFTYVQVGNTITFTNTSTNATSYLWHFGNGDTSTAINPVEIYLNNGTYTVTLIAYNASGCLDSTTQLITILTTGFYSADFVNNGLSIYPNPTEGMVNVAIKLNLNEQIQLTVTDILGQKVYDTSPVINCKQILTL